MSDEDYPNMFCQLPALAVTMSTTLTAAMLPDRSVSGLGELRSEKVSARSALKL
jgi:hypothetical protein